MNSPKLRFAVLQVALLLANRLACAQQRRKVIIDQDCSGPGGSNMQTLLTLIQSPQVEVLGITVVSGNQWRDEEVARTLRLLELIGRTDIPVVPGAVFPLVHRRQEAQLWQARYGKVAFAGAWELLRLHHPTVAAEVAAVVSAVVPLASPAHGQVSSSSPEAFGAVAMSEPIDARSKDAA